MRILVFTEGTILMHRSASGHSRQEIVRQVKRKEPTVPDYASYIPIGHAAKKLQRWRQQGAEIMYLTSRVKPDEVKDINNVLNKHKFPFGKLLYRKKDELYKDVAERVVPDVLIEDDCESMGGKKEMTITHVAPLIKKRIRSIQVREFAGINHLPDKLQDLQNSA